MFDNVVNWLVDTGAPPNVLSWNTYQKIDDDIKPTLRRTEADLRAADGNPLTLYGVIDIDVHIAGKLFTIPVMVADIGNLDGILGMQFLEDENCIIDINRGRLMLGNIEVFMHRHETSECCRIRLAESQTIPPYSEHVIIGQIDQKRWHETSSIGSVDPVASFVKNTGLFVSRAIVDTTKPKFAMTCTNFRDEPVHIEKGTTVALLQSIQEIYHISNLSSEVHVKKNIDIEDFPEHLRDMITRASEGLNDENLNKMYDLLFRNQAAFVGADGKLGKTHLTKHSINTGNARPIKCRPYRPALKQKQIIENQIEEMLQNGQIEPSESPWAAPVVLITKKDGSPRFCVDYRLLNSATVKDTYPLPNIHDCIDSLSGAKWFSTLDLASGYWQCEVEELDRPKTAFVTHKGLYQFNVLPFGLTNAPATFERLMERIMNGLQWDRCLIYLDDIIVYGKTFDEASDNLQCVLTRIQEAGLTLKPKKCDFFKEQVSFLGHLVSSEGVKCEPDKINAVKNWPTPKTVTDVRSFLGFTNYYRRFIESYSHTASPLTALTEKGKRFDWTQACVTAFEQMKTKLTEAPVLAYPEKDSQYILDTDASNLGIGAVLSQVQNGTERVIAYASKALSATQKKYCTTYRELLAVVVFVKHFRHYLLGQEHIIIRTDHNSLRWLMNFKDVEGMVGRWLLSLQPYNFVIQHRRGVDHGNADGLSRQIPIPVKRRRRCGREECFECPTGSASRICAIQAVPRGPTKHNNHSSITTHSGGSSDLLMANSMVSDTQEQYADATGASIDSGVVNEDSNWMNNWSQTDLKDMQHKDEAINKVLNWKAEERVCPGRLELLAESSEVRDLCSMWKSLEVHNGVLYRRWYTKHLKQLHFQLVAPTEIREEILKSLHNNITAGHLGTKRTLKNIRHRFFWPRCKDDVNRWCLQCTTCAQIKPGPGYRAKLTQFPVRHKLDRIALDILGELPETENGNKYVLVVSDYYTKWTHAMAMPDQTAQTVADKLAVEFIAYLGTPKTIHTDQGRNFESKLFASVCDLLGIEKTRTTPYHAQSDGQVERWNRTIQQMLKAFVNDNRDDWDDHLPYLCMAYRATPHESTGCSPNLMMFGEENNMPIDVMVGGPPTTELDTPCPIEYVEWLRGSLKNAYAYANKQLGVNAKRQKQYYDLKAKPHTYHEGSLVWRWYPPISRGKLSKGWAGPYKVIKCPSPIHCVIKKMPDDAGVRVHIDSLKPYNGPIPEQWENVDNSNIDENGHADDNVDQNIDVNGSSIPSHDSSTPLNDSPTQSNDSPTQSNDSSTPLNDSPTQSNDSPTQSNDSSTPADELSDTDELREFSTEGSKSLSPVNRRGPGKRVIRKPVRFSP